MKVAKFRDSTVRIDEAIAAAPADPTAGPAPDVGTVLHDRSIGDIIRQTNNLTADQVEQILAHQRANNMRFGEAAVALGFASERDVLFALSLQFHYPYSRDPASTLSGEVVMASKPFSAQAESFRVIRSQLSMRIFNGDGPKAALAVVSPEPGDGKTYFAANVAVALSQLGGRTLLVDADLRGPRQHAVFRVENTSGLSGILAGHTERNVIQQVRDFPSLYILPVGTTPPNPLELLDRQAFSLLLRDLSNKFDHVIVDTSAAVYGSDAQIVAAKCGAALLVARKNTSRLAALHDLLGSLACAPIKVAGVVLNEY